MIGKTYCIALLLAAVAWSTPAHADRQTAAAKYKAGSAAFARGDFREAATCFDAAYEQDPRSASAYNAAQSWASAGDPVRAVDDFELALRAGDLASELASAARTQLDKLMPQVGRIHIDGVVGTLVEVGARAPAPVPFEIRLAPGRYPVRARSGATLIFDREIEIVAGREVRVALVTTDVIVLQSGAPAPASPMTPVPTAPASRRPETQTQTTGFFGSATLPIGVGFIALAAAVGGTSAYLGVKTSATLDDYAAGGYRSQDLHDCTVSLRTWTNVALAGAVISAALGVTALVTARTHHGVSMAPGIVYGRF